MYSSDGIPEEWRFIYWYRLYRHIDRKSRHGDLQYTHTLFVTYISSFSSKYKTNLPDSWVHGDGTLISMRMLRYIVYQRLFLLTPMFWEKKPTRHCYFPYLISRYWSSLKFSVFCVVLYPMLYVSLECPFFITTSDRCGLLDFRYKKYVFVEQTFKLGLNVVS